MLMIGCISRFSASAIFALTVFKESSLAIEKDARFLVRKAFTNDLVVIFIFFRELYCARKHSVKGAFCLKNLRSPQAVVDRPSKISAPKAAVKLTRLAVNLMDLRGRALSKLLIVRTRFLIMDITWGYKRCLTMLRLRTSLNNTEMSW